MDLRPAPEEKLKLLEGKKILLIGIGNPLRGDDGAGIALARRLLEQRKPGVIDAGATPENHLGPARDYDPEIILLADALYCGSRNSWGLFRSDEIFSGPASTHNSSLAVVMEFLEKETGAEVFLLGIKARDRSWGKSLSPETEHTVNELAGLFGPLLA